MSSQPTDIQNYLSDIFACEDEILLKIKARSKREKLPKIAVPRHVGKLLYCLAKIQKPDRILELGTLAGYSTLWLARALPAHGKLISLEIEPKHATLAREHFKMAGLENLIELREGNALDLLDRMIADHEKPFDLIFIDADKKNYPFYLDKVLHLSRPGTLILSDNLVPKNQNHPIHTFNQKVANHPRLETTLVTTLVDKKSRIDALGISIVL